MTDKFDLIERSNTIGRRKLLYTGSWLVPRMRGAPRFIESLSRRRRERERKKGL